ncbi:hypothetical protein ACFCXS_10220 [Streptomyces sp. NPDC056373]|uniref:hypothetical protein n=1 Tax=Streptomyces sp. NPDC056373 TaxID=3345798 RepID=UPI0035DA9E65
MRRRGFISGLAGVGAGLALVPASGGPVAAAAAGATGEARAWQAVPAPDGTPAAQLRDVAAAGGGLAWAVGEEGRSGGTLGSPLALVWDGTAWARTGLAHLGFRGYLHSVAGTCARSAWAIGTDTAGGTHLLAWDGGTWRETDFPGRGGTSLTDVVVDPDGGAWFSGRTSDGRLLLRHDGGTWTWLPAPPSAPTVTPSGVRLTPSGDVWLYGVGIVARWDGSDWTELPAYQGIRASITGLLPVADDDLWLVGYDYGVGGPVGKPPGVLLLHGDGSTWQGVTEPFRVGMLSGIVADAQGRPDRIAGWDFWDQTRAHYLRWDGTAWVSERGPVASAPVVMNALAGVPGSGGYWAVGTTSTSASSAALLRIER